MFANRMVREWAAKCLCNFTYGITQKGQRDLLNPQIQNLSQADLADQEFLNSIYENISNPKFLDLSLESQVSIVSLSLATVIGITANIYVLLTMTGTLNARTNSSPLMINIALADLLLLINAPFKIYLQYQNSTSKFNIGSGLFKNIFCKYYHGVKQLGMLATLLNVTMTAVVRYSSLTSWSSYSVSTYKKIGLFAWILAALFTVPIFVYADVFIVGEADDHSSQVCRIRWSRIGRDECKAVVLDSYSDCEIEVESCRQQEPNERVYYLIVLFLAVILPIGISYLANIGVVRQLKTHQSTLGELTLESPFLDKRRQQFQKTQKAVKRNVLLFAFAILLGAKCDTKRRFPGALL